VRARVPRWLPPLAGASVLAAHALLVLRALQGRQFAKYPQAAALLLEGALPRERLADFSPLYLWLHVAARLLPSPGAWVVAFQVVLAAASAALLAVALQRFFSPRAALAGVLAFALCRGVAIHAVILEPEALLLFLVLAAAALLPRGDRRALAAAGLLLALAALLRPSVLPLAALVPFGLRLDGRRGAAWRSDVARFLAFPLLAVLLLSAVNLAAGGGFSPAVMNPGDVFFEGNNPLSHGQSAVYPPLVQDLRLAFGEQPDRQHLSYRLVARRTAGRDLTPPEVNAAWRGRALAYIRDYPGRFLRNAARKAELFLHGFRLHDVVAAQQVEADLDRMRVPSFPFGLVAALALPGMWVMARRRRECWPAYAVLLVQATVVVAMYASERQRVVAVPFLVFFAVAALDHLATGGRRLFLLAAVLPLAVLLQAEDDMMRDERHRWEGARLADSMVVMARRLRDEGRFSQASGVASLAAAAAPLSMDNLRPAYVPFPGGYTAAALASGGAPAEDDAPARFDRGILLLEAGRPAEADAVFAELEFEGRRFNRLYEGSSEPAFYRGRAALARGDRGCAADFFRQALERAPGEPFALAWLAALTGDTDSERRLSRYFGEADARFLLGRAHLDAGNAAAAVDCFAYVVSILPEHRRGRMYFAAALAAAGRPDAAAEAYRAAAAMGIEPLLREGEILSAFRDLSARAPGERAAAFRLGTVLTQFGRFPEALAVQKSVRDPAAAPEVEAEIRWLEWALGSRS
jgi:tetratricopeptide (TPR) repeat protein